jgi:large subunit ribosomal protein L10
MPRPEKVQAVAEIKERLEQAQAVFLAEYAGLSVKEQQTLRRGLREGGAEFKVVKMTLARRAAAELELAELDELLLGPTGIAFADGDPVTAAKALKEFARENDALAIKGGLLGRDFLSPERISELADIESREVLLAQLAGLMKAPMANLAGLLAAMPRNMASAIQQLVEKKEEAGEAAPVDAGDAEAPEEEAPAEEAPAETPAAEADSATEDAAAAADAEEATGEAAASEDEAEDTPEASADSDEESTESEDEADDAATAASDSADSDEDEQDGDEAKSVDEDSADEAEEA